MDEDPILKHLLSVENKATMKGPLVKDYLSIDINAEYNIDCEEAIRKFTGEAAFDDESDLDSKIPAVEKERLGPGVVKIKNEATVNLLPAKRKPEDDDDDDDEIVEVIVKKKPVEVLDLIDD